MTGSNRIWLLPIVLLVLVALRDSRTVDLHDLCTSAATAGLTPADAQLAELRSALQRMGHEVPPRTTLSALERRLRTIVGPAAARYVAPLR